MDRGVERTRRCGVRAAEFRQRWKSERISKNLCFKSLAEALLGRERGRRQERRAGGGGGKVKVWVQKRFSSAQLSTLRGSY